MASFNEILSAPEEDLVRTFFNFRGEQLTEDTPRITLISQNLKLRTAQLVCALGFNSHVKNLVEVMPILGYASIDDLVSERNDYFINDIYKKLTLENILAIYTAVKNNDDFLQVMPYLIKNRLKTIESRIEATVNSLIIDKYKAEMRAIYSERIVSIDFAEERLDNVDSGFRALLNEVTIITESKLIPVGDIFFRESVLPEEKRKLLNKGLIPDELIEARLEDENASPEEKHMLYEYLKYKK
ncbi:MAG: hypothetical protein R3318_02775 [Gammaproteobacteria bacterium]|nr:hypothetical protein [Gammaproteobacteria bacterium]